MVLARGSTPMDAPGVGPVVAARILADAGDVARFADRNGFASWTGTAPLDASSGEQIRHRGKTGLESIRCLKRRISHAVYRQLLADVQRNQYLEPAEADGTGPGGHWEASQESRAVDLFPHIDTLDQPLPGPAITTLQPATHARKSAERQSLKTTG